MVTNEHELSWCIVDWIGQYTVALACTVGWITDVAYCGLA